ncbi:MAG: S24 family peptidase [Bacteriovorax sp.]|nr:S24 family peptidase [Bacteriovorax sp.]
MSDKIQDTLSPLKAIDLPVGETNTEFPKIQALLSCGLFGISDDFIEKYQSLDSLFVKNKFSTFFFEAAGDSMEPTIFQGQILIVDRSRKDFHGRVCVICFEDKMICKRVLQKSNAVILKSDNSKYKDIVIENNEGLICWGVVIASAGVIT